MGAMSDLDIMADEVRDNVQSGLDIEEAIDAVARHSVKSRDDIEWAYREKYGGEV